MKDISATAKTAPKGRGAGRRAVGKSPAEAGWQGTLHRALEWGIVAVLVLIPFHAFLTTWLAAQTGHFDLIRIWKELLVFAFCSIAGVLLFLRQDVLRLLARNRLVQLMAAYLALLLVMFTYGLFTDHVSSSAAIYGLLVDGRFFGFFLLVMVVVALGGKSGKAAAVQRLSGPLRQWRRLVFIPAALVVGFALMQYALPADFLGHFGYGPATIPTHQTVDNKPDYVRLQSTLRGPNPFGAYLLLITALLLAAALASRYKRVQYGLLGAAGLLALYGTYSRSAWLGTLLAGTIVLFLSIRSPQHRRKLLVTGVVAAAGALAMLVILRHNTTFQNVIFHTSNTSRSATSSNQKRADALEAGWREVLHTPLGNGVGSAGPASLRNTAAPARLSENYLLQVAQETGWLGLVLFTAAIVLTGMTLYRQRSDSLALGLLAALAGLTLVNFLSHAWADDTLAYLFWGLAALALAPTLAAAKSNPASISEKKR